MAFIERVDWDANNGALALRLIEELRNGGTVRRVLWRRKNESHCDPRDQESIAMAVAKVLFPLESDEVRLTFNAIAVVRRIKNIRSQFNNVKKLLQTKGKHIDWEMETVEGSPVQRKWAEVLRRCPHFRTYAFFNGAITESEIGGSASDEDPLAPSTKRSSPQDDPNALNEKSAPRNRGAYAAEPSEESDGTDGEYRGSDSEGNNWEEGNEELDGEINQGTGNGEVEEEVITQGADQAQLREGSTRLTSASGSVMSTPTNCLDPQSRKRHWEASPYIATKDDIEFRREQMQLDYNYKLEKRRFKQKEKEKRMDLEELDRVRKHEERMIDRRIKLAKIEKGKGGGKG